MQGETRNVLKIVQMDGFEGRIGAGLWKMAKKYQGSLFLAAFVCR